MIYTRPELNELVEDYKDYLLGYRSDNTALNYSLDAQHLLERVQCDTDKLDRAEIRKFIEYGTGTKRGRPMSQVRRRASMKAFVQYMRDEHPDEAPSLTIDVIESVPTPKLSRHLPQFLTVEEMTALLDTMGQTDNPLDIRNRAMVELMYSGGLRVQELLTLMCSQFHPERGEVNYLHITGKGDKERVVMMGKTAVKWVYRYLDKARPSLSEDKSTWLFVSQHGNKLSTNVMRSILRDAAVKAGIDPDKVHPHAIRHSFATHMLQGGANLMTIKEILGHESIATTQVYLSVSNRDKMNEFEKAFPRQ